MPTTNRNAPIGGSSELVREQERALHPGVRDAQVLAAHETGEQRAARGVGERLGGPEREQGERGSTAMLTVPPAIVATSRTSTAARTRFTTMTIRRRSNRSAATPPMIPKSRAGRYSLSSARETRNGSRVCEATRSGPADEGNPSPTLLTTVADRSQRKFRPSRAGAMTSAIAIGGWWHQRGSPVRPLRRPAQTELRTGMGGPSRNPCPSVTPSSRRTWSSASVSIPSAISREPVSRAK